jgi:cytochrome c5
MKTLILLLSFFISLFTSNASFAKNETIESLISNQTKEAYQLGQQRYEKHCFTCHAPSNIMVSSPKPGDNEEWLRRLKAAGSFKNLVKSASKGKGAMPAKGLCLDCKESDLAAAITYMMKGLP